MSLSMSEETFLTSSYLYTCSLILINGSGAPINLKKNSIDFLVPFDL